MPLQPNLVTSTFKTTPRRAPARTGEAVPPLSKDIQEREPAPQPKEPESRKILLSQTAALPLACNSLGRQMSGKMAVNSLIFLWLFLSSGVSGMSSIRPNFGPPLVKPFTGEPTEPMLHHNGMVPSPFGRCRPPLPLTNFVGIASQRASRASPLSSRPRSCPRSSISTKRTRMARPSREMPASLAL